MCQSIKGDYEIPNDLRILDSDEMKNYRFIDCIGKYSLYNLQDTHDYILGYATSKGFRKVAKLYLNKIEEHCTSYNEVDTIYVSKALRGENIATLLYTYLVKTLNYTILSANMQRFGARRLWAKLSRETDLTVDIIDFDNNRIIEEDVEIYHGEKDEEFDNRVWSYSADKKHIRLILRDKRT
jgi:hypothetical protein